jgi:hypothetical protein
MHRCWPCRAICCYPPCYPPTTVLQVEVGDDNLDGLHLHLNGIGLGVLKHGGEPVGEQAELADKQRQVLRGDQLEVADGRELGHAGRALHGDAEVLVVVQAVGELRDGADRVRLDDDVYELELRRERVEAVGLARVVPDDAHKVVADVSLFVVELRVVLVVRHQGGVWYRIWPMSSHHA